MTFRNRLAAILLALALCLILGGCGLTRGNEQADIDQAVRQVEEQYGIHLTVTKKNPLPGGVSCDVTVRCDELPGKDIRVFRFDDQNPVNTDYIYMKYGEEAYHRIQAVSERVFPGVKMVTYDDCYNHFPAEWYDRNTTLEEYLQHNDFCINFIFSEIYDEQTMREQFDKAVDAFLADGINGEHLNLYCMKTPQKAADVKTFSYIPRQEDVMLIKDSNDVAMQAVMGVTYDFQEYSEHRGEKGAVGIY